MDSLFRDVQYALRTLRNAPGFTAVAIVTLALGIGANTTIFSMVNALLLRPLPVERPDELVDMYGQPSNYPAEFGTTSWLDYLEFRENADTLTGIAAYSNFFANFAQDGRSELVVGEIVSDNYFDVLGVRPLLGRGFQAEEFVDEGAVPVVVLGFGFWQSRFGGSRDVLGQTARLNGLDYTIVGVAPEEFGGMMPAARAQMWVPTMMVDQVEVVGNQRWTGGDGSNLTRLQRRGQRWLWMRGRRAAGVSAEQVQAEVDAISARLREAHPDSNELETLRIVPTGSVRINPAADGAIGPAGALILGVVGLVLLVACANLANMLLARAAARQREIAIRLAIGAGRIRLVRQLMVESLTLALAGGAAGLLMAYWLLGLIAAYRPPLPIEFEVDFSLDWRVMGFTLVAAAITGIAFGLVPALRASRPDLVPALKDAGESDTGRGRRITLRDALVVLQVAVSIVLLIGGALLVRSLQAAHRTDLGYDIDNLSFLAVPLEMNGYEDGEGEAFFTDARARISALPGVQGVTVVSRVPLSVNNNGFGLFIDGHQSSSSDRPYIVDGQYIDEAYRRTMDLELTSGRDFTSADIAENASVALVTQALADRYWPDESAVGQQFRTTWEGEPFTIVGVLGDYKVNTPGEEPTPFIHIPRRSDSLFGNFIVRTAGTAIDQVALQEAAVREIDPDFVFLDSGGMRKLAEVRLFAISLGAWLIGAFGVLALILAAVGLYGVIGYSVSRRTREIGIRMALGAERSFVVTLVLRQGMRLVVIGAVAGMLLAALAGRLLSSVLFVSAIDPVAFAGAAFVLLAVAGLANWIPAKRAARVDPMVSLRSE
jgi:predicted permease